ncbi:hypothetical protein [Streptomyces sp. NPDC056401]|uniref:hypothetical protein n=1 Tax=Streptomyces sp. NPDC056401 TaxID=3345809 RepID=UPI0035D5B668
MATLRLGFSTPSAKSFDSAAGAGRLDLIFTGPPVPLPHMRPAPVRHRPLPGSDTMRAARSPGRCAS